MAKPTKKMKDLGPRKSAVKGGARLAGNDNLTLVRAAKPTINKDLPPRKDIKGAAGKKIV
jgi:hypothetical protein